MTDAPDVPTFAEKGYQFYWEQMRGVVGPAGMAPEAVKWWQDTLKKVDRDEEVAGRLHQAQPPDADHVDRRGGQQVPRRPHRQVREGARRPRRAEEVGRGTSRAPRRPDRRRGAAARSAWPSPRRRAEAVHVLGRERARLRLPSVLARPGHGDAGARRCSSAPSAPREPGRRLAAARRRPAPARWSCSAPRVLFVALLNVLGMTLGTALFLLGPAPLPRAPAPGRSRSPSRWPSPVCNWLVFACWLQVPLPVGVLGF